MLKTKQQKATALAIFLHAAGAIGILFFDRTFFVPVTPYLVVLMTLLVFYTHEKANKGFLLFFAICFAGGFAAELLGTSTQLLFGDYRYGKLLGPAFKNVPVVIGFNWFIIIYCCGITVNMVLDKLSRKLSEMTGNPQQNLRFISLVTDAAMLSVFFDWVMEPAAVKLGYWSWGGDTRIPLFNYACWLVISALLLFVFSFLKFGKRNIFAVNLLLIMMMFFMIIRAFL